MAKKGKKEEYEILSPELLGKKHIGITFGAEPKKLVGRILKSNAKLLLNTPGGSNVVIKLRINNVEGKTAETEIIGYELLRQYFLRLTRKKLSKVEVIFEDKTKEEKRVRVRAFAVTPISLQQEKKKLLRQELKKQLNSILKKNSFETFITIISENKAQRIAVASLKKFCPVRSVEVRKASLIK